MPPKGGWVGDVAFTLRTCVFGPPPPQLGGKPPYFLCGTPQVYTHTYYFSSLRSFIAPKAGGVIIPSAEKRFESVVRGSRDVCL